MKLIFALFFLLFFLPVSHAQNWTFSEVTDEFSSLLEKTKESNKNSVILAFLREEKQLKLLGDEEYLHFIKLAQTQLVENEDSLTELLFFIGREFQIRGKYLDAYPLFYRVEKRINSADKPFPHHSAFLEIYGMSFYFFRRFDDATRVFQQALSKSTITAAQKINIYNTLGLIESQNFRLKEAERYFQEALALAKVTKKEPWIGVISGNLGVVYLNRGEKKKAIEFFTLDYHKSRNSGETGSAVNALCELLHFDNENKNFANAALKVKSLDSLMKKIESKSVKARYYEALTEYLEEIGQYKQALEKYQLSVLYKDSVEKEKDLVNFNNTEFQFQFERKQNEIKLLEAKRKADEFRIFMLILALLIIIIGALLVIQQISKRRQNEKELLELKNQQIEEVLKRTENELLVVVQDLIKKNAIVTDLSEELEKIQDEKKDEVDSENEELSHRLQSFTLLTEENWVEFKRLFEKLFPGFFDYFQTRFPDITNAEIRMAALLKINLENIEMAKALGISPDSVRKTNLRLRKRLNIEDQRELQELIRSISAQYIG